MRHSDNKMNIIGGNKAIGHTLKTCRMCQSGNLTEFLDLEHTPLADGFITGAKLKEPEVYYPLQVLICQDCGLAQLGYVVSPEILFADDYPYESSTTKLGREHFFNMAKTITERFGLGQKDLAVDIGSNVGVLLAGFKAAGTRVLGIEPALNLAERANSQGIDTIHFFFNNEAVEQAINSHGSARVVTATNVFAHIDDLDAFMHCLRKLLSPGGLFVFEAPYFVDLLENLEYDTIYHEHLSYISVEPLTKFFPRHGFEVFDVEKVGIHGGSIRVYVAPQGMYTPSSRIQEFIQLEQKAGVFSLNKLHDFARRVKENRDNLRRLLFELKNQGKKLAGVSAPAKGNTLLNYCKITSDTLNYLTEKSTLKIGLYSPGMHIPVVSDDRLLEDKPDYALLLAWNFKQEIMRNLTEYKKRGGKFIVPIPTPEIV